MEIKTKYTISELNSINSWRGILAIIVFIAHLFQINYYSWAGNTGILQDSVSTIANISVVIFFLLSGMLISYSAYGLVDNSIFNWKKYFINRITRIYPNFIAVLFILGILVLIYPFITGTTEIILYGDIRYFDRTYFSATFMDFIYSFFWLPSNLYKLNGPLWSLVIEIYLYMSFMFLYKGFYLNNKIQKWASYSLGILIFISTFYINGIANLPYGIIWCIGALYTLYFRNKNILFKNIVFLCTGIFMMVYFIKYGLYGMNINGVGGYPYSVFQILMSILFIKIITQINLGTIISYSSKFSYTLYIIHFPLILFIFAIFHKYYIHDTYSNIVFNIVLFIIILGISHFISDITENKQFFRKYFNKFTKKNT